MNFFNPTPQIINLSEPISSVTRNSQHIYLSTSKTNSIMRFEIPNSYNSNLQEQKPFKIQKVTQKPILKICLANFEADDYLLLLSDNQIYFCQTNSLSPNFNQAECKDKISDISTSPDGKFICAVSLNFCLFFEFSSPNSLKLVQRIQLSKNPTKMFMTNEYLIVKLKSKLCYINLQTKKVDSQEFDKVNNILLVNCPDFSNPLSLYTIFNENTIKQNCLIIANQNKLCLPSFMQTQNSYNDINRYFANIKVPPNSTYFSFNYPFAYSLQSQMLNISNSITHTQEDIKLPSKIKTCSFMFFENMKSFFIFSEKTILFFQPQDITQNISALLGDNELEKSLMVCSSFSTEITPKLNDLYQKYCDSLILDFDYNKAFSIFSLSTLPPQNIICHFTTMIPKEIKSDKALQSEWFSQRNLIPVEMQRNRRAINCLSNFIQNGLKEWKDLSQNVKTILNTILVECLLFLNVNSLDRFMKTKPEIFFDTLKDFFLSNDDQQHFLNLCQIYEHHKDAIDFLEDKDDVDDLILYCRESDDFTSISKQCYDYICKKVPDKSYLLFCNKNIRASVAFDILHFIDTSNSLPTNEERENSQIAFLEYLVYERKIEDTDIHNKLITIYLSTITSYLDKNYTSSYGGLSSSDQKDSQYTMIEDEKEPLKTLRSRLKRVLIESNYYHALSISPKILPSLLEERLIVNGKAGNFNSCLDMMVYSADGRISAPNKVILEFCDYIYPQHKSIYTELIVKFASNMTTMKDKFMYFLNERGNMCEVGKVLKLIPKDTPISKYEKFIKSITIDREEENTRLKLSVAILTSQMKSKETELKTIKSTKFVLKSPPLCHKCGEQITSNFVCDQIGNVYHPDCV